VNELHQCTPYFYYRVQQVKHVAAILYNENKACIDGVVFICDCHTSGTWGCHNLRLLRRTVILWCFVLFHMIPGGRIQLNVPQIVQPHPDSVNNSHCSCVNCYWSGCLKMVLFLPVLCRSV
jgi:hypothetical protein